MPEPTTPAETGAPDLAVQDAAVAETSAIAETQLMGAGPPPPPPPPPAAPGRSKRVTVRVVYDGRLVLEPGGDGYMAGNEIKVSEAFAADLVKDGLVELV